eukprot:TRINITY_DN670_c0_g1_i1.p1 TRINITY_DN670_c0_g1~~TRINITY_DN670_c0_g1_i1.p1  ORF type:complete len:237 (-),score=56.90 TRINITY_DN670_c0_g1_i1:38-748(-)
MYVYGGTSHSGDINCHLFRLDLVSSHWEQIETKNNPICRMEHVQVLLPGEKIFVYGGNNNDGILKDASVLDLNTREWTAVKDSGYEGRLSSSATLIEDNILIFGGIKYFGKEGYTNDLLKYNIESNTWNKVKQENKIDPRGAHIALTTTNNNMLILEGYWEIYQDDVQFFNTKSSEWELLDAGRSFPFGRSHGSGVSKGNTVYLFGGSDGNWKDEVGFFTNEIWRLELDETSLLTT